MPSIDDYNITEDQIRSFVQRGKQDALSYPQLQAIAYDYLNKVMRKAQKFDKWPKDVKDLCYSVGIRQDKETGLPIYDENGVMPWSMRAEEAEGRLTTAYHIIAQVRADIAKALEVDASESGYCDRYGCEQFQETIKEIMGLGHA